MPRSSPDVSQIATGGEAAGWDVLSCETLVLPPCSSARPAVDGDDLAGLSSETLVAAGPPAEARAVASLSVASFEVLPQDVAALESTCGLDALASRLVREMGTAWWQGQSVQVEDYLARHPALQSQPAAALRLVREEVRLRQRSGADVAPDELRERFPQWGHRLEEVFEPSSIVPPSARSPRLPGTDEQLGEYRLQAVLGRGVRGAVYLAEQSNLANRPVVLKVTPRDGSEHLSLARLQHAHIVPLYAVQDFVDRDLRGLCMPYLGGTTLARVLSAMGEIPPGQRSGQSVLAEVDQAQSEMPVVVPSQGPARQLLMRLSYNQVVCWLGACLADALSFAHERGLLHLDLKPSNILIAADGTPMLLDFHLARAPIQRDEQVRHRLGGTLAYMPSEQWAAMVSVREGRPSACVVDCRTDLYALGLLLYEMVGGTVPSGYCPSLPLKYRHMPHVPVGLSDILAKCLAFRPEDRYPSAELLADDLRRQLTDMPLRGVANRSLPERWRKWRRRRPQAFGRAAAVLVALAGLLLGAAVTGTDVRRRLHSAEGLLDEARAWRTQHNDPAAVRCLERGLAVLDPGRTWLLGPYVARAGALRTTLERELGQARQAALAGELHALADRVRLLYGAEITPSASARALQRRLSEAWAARGTILALIDSDLAPELKDRLRTDALDLAVLGADLGVRLAPPGGDTARRLDALRTLAEAELTFGASPVLDRERQVHSEALGLVDDQLAALTRPLAGRPARTAWEHYALGRSRLAAGDLDGAAAALDQCVELKPDSLWGHFSRGVCAYRRHAFAAAAHDFDVCVALAPSSAECYYNRARAHASLGDTEQAARDYGEALRLDPHLAAAALNRGVIHYRQGRYAAALADFRRARDDGADPAVVRHNLALAESAKAAHASAFPRRDAR